VGQLLKNLSFTSTWKAPDGQRPGRQDEARRRRQGLAEKNPQVLDTWLAGVTTVDGKPGLEAVKAKLAQ
jgi:glycine betaine/proline transport system substrate-binding protein